MRGKSKSADASIVFQWLSYLTVVAAMSCTTLSASPVGGRLVDEQHTELRSDREESWSGGPSKAYRSEHLASTAQPEPV